MREVGETAVELTVGKPYEEEWMAVEGDDGNDEATVWCDPCNNGVADGDGDKVNNDAVDSFIVVVVVVVVVTAAVVAAVGIVTDDKDCT